MKCRSYEKLYRYHCRCRCDCHWVEKFSNLSKKIQPSCASWRTKSKICDYVQFDCYNDAHMRSPTSNTTPATPCMGHGSGWKHSHFHFPKTVKIKLYTNTFNSSFQSIVYSDDGIIQSKCKNAKASAQQFNYLPRFRQSGRRGSMKQVKSATENPLKIALAINSVRFCVFVHDTQYMYIVYTMHAKQQGNHLRYLENWNVPTL